ncbi:hypothetical protein RhiirA4_428472 [Rhizophagus irregularis]|uniref:Uncharacterized protein n=1 Tax=Rhizophagus irregularis TaxID=588596 RepID=A0A2I1HD36_9GLOM|nr:hypothetical protein RhiirA4_428472 [Rhizophagus irregularis]
MKTKEKRHTGCFAHNINLLVINIIGIPWCASIITSVKEIVKFFKNHHVESACLVRLQKEKLGKEIRLQLPGNTCWGSHHACLLSFVQSMKALQIIVFVEQLCEFLNHFTVIYKLLKVINRTYLQYFTESCGQLTQELLQYHNKSGPFECEHLWSDEAVGDPNIWWAVLRTERPVIGAIAIHQQDTLNEIDEEDFIMISSDEEDEIDDDE